MHYQSNTYQNKWSRENKTMSKEEKRKSGMGKTGQADNGKNNLNLKVAYGIIAILLVVVIILSVLLASSKGAGTDNSNSDDIQVVDSSNENNIITTYEYAHEVLKGDKASQAIGNVNTILSKMDNDNTYLVVQVSESDYNVYLYNKKNECFAQSSDGSYSLVYLSDGNVIKYDAYTSEAEVSNDVGIKDLMHSVIDCAADESNGIDIYEMLTAEDEQETETGTGESETETTGDESTTETEERFNSHEYRFDVKGESAVKEVYSVAGEEFADTMINSLKEQIGNDWEPHLIFSYLVSNDENITIACYLILNNQEILNWVSDGYLTFGDWELDSKWYEPDASENAEELLKDTVETINSLMDAYAEENGLEIEGNEPTTSEVLENETSTVESETVTETESETSTETGTSTEETESSTVIETPDNESEAMSVEEN